MRVSESNLKIVEEEDIQAPKRVVKLGPHYCSPYRDRKCLLSEAKSPEEIEILDTILGTDMSQG